MKLYEIETEQPDGQKTSVYHRPNLRARCLFSTQPLGDNTLRLYRVGFTLTETECLESWANGKVFREQPATRALLASRYPDIKKEAHHQR